MRPYYEDSAVTIYHGSCRELLPTLAPVDLVLTDPPYGIGIDGQAESVQSGVSIRKRYDFKGWDSAPPNAEFVAAIIAAGTDAVIFGGNYLPVPHGSKGWIVWDKGQRGLTMSDCELVFTTLDRPTRILTLHRSRLWREKPQHPTQKPLELVETIMASIPGETVIDPFMGSGTTLVAAKNLGRKAIGIDLEEEYCEIAAQRCSQEVLAL